MVETDELNTKLLKFAGFEQADIKKHYYWKLGERYPKWKEPNSSYNYKPPNFTDPGIGIAYCFKWLVPKLKELGIAGSILYVWLPKIIVNDEEPALALCLAISKLIEQDVDNAKQ